MKESIIATTLAVCSVILIIAAGAGRFLSDRTAPVIELKGKNDLVYTEGDPEETLLEHVTASDDRDGDVTDSLRVADLHVTSKDRAVVIYVARDQENNIGKLKREIRYRAAEIPQAPEAEEASEETEAPEGEATEQNQPSQTPEEETPEPEEETAEEGQEEEENDGPRITLLQTSATLKVGEPFNVLRYVQSAVDRDGTNLSRFIHADGTYDMNRPGTYEIRIYATNANGENSNIETFTLTVEQ